MDVVRVWRDVPQSFKGAVLAIGNFDGVHRGHQAVLGEALRIAQAEAPCCSNRIPASSSSPRSRSSG